MVDYRQVWMDGSGDAIPAGWHVHHLIPRSEGGPDEYWNLICVSPEMHYDIHFVRGDYGACALISDGIDREAPAKIVRQYDLDGHLVGIFNSSTEAQRAMGKPEQGGIRMCAEYRSKSQFGYQWFYESEVGDIDYIGPVERVKSKVNGNSTSRTPYINLNSMELFKSLRAASRGDGVSCYYTSNIPNHLLKITKEEYYYLSELKQL